MRLAYELLESPEKLYVGRICCITIENSYEFKRVLDALQNAEDRVSFYKDNEPLKPKEFIFIENILSMDLNDRKVIGKVYKYLEELMLEEDFLIRTNNLSSIIGEYLEDLIFESDFPLGIQEDFNRQNLLKAMGLNVINESETFVEKIIDYFELVLRFSDYKLIVFANLLAYLDEVELAQLIRFAEINGLSLVTIERIRTNNTFIDQANHILFDKDLCRVI